MLMFRRPQRQHDPGTSQQQPPMAVGSETGSRPVMQTQRKPSCSSLPMHRHRRNPQMVLCRPQRICLLLMRRRQTSQHLPAGIRMMPRSRVRLRRLRRTRPRPGQLQTLTRSKEGWMRLQAAPRQHSSPLACKPLLGRTRRLWPRLTLRQPCLCQVEQRSLSLQRRRRRPGNSLHSRSLQRRRRQPSRRRARSRRRRRSCCCCPTMRARRRFKRRHWPPSGSCTPSSSPSRRAGHSLGRMWFQDLGFRAQVREEVQAEALATFREVHPIYGPFQARGLAGPSRTCSACGRPGDASLRAPSRCHGDAIKVLLGFLEMRTELDNLII